MDHSRALPSEILTSIFRLALPYVHPLLHHQASRQLNGRYRSPNHQWSETTWSNKMLRPLEHGKEIQYETIMKPIAEKVSRVCKRWRRVVMNDRSNWSTTILCERYSGNRAEAIMAGLESHLAAPANDNSELFVLADCGYRLRDHMPTFDHILFPLLEKFGHRIVALSVHCCKVECTEIPRMWNALQIWSLPRLERLQIGASEDSQLDVSVPQLPIKLPPSSRITTLTIQPPVTAAGWPERLHEQLSVLHVDFKYVRTGRRHLTTQEDKVWTDLMDDISKCQALQHLSLQVNSRAFPVCFCESDKAEVLQICLPNLRSLSLKTMDGHVGTTPFWRIFRWIRTPGLQELHVSGWDVSFRGCGRSFASDIHNEIPAISIQELRTFAATLYNDSTQLFLCHTGLNRLEEVYFASPAQSQYSDYDEDDDEGDDEEQGGADEENDTLQLNGLSDSSLPAGLRHLSLHFPTPSTRRTRFMRKILTNKGIVSLKIHSRAMSVIERHDDDPLDLDFDIDDFRSSFIQLQHLVIASVGELHPPLAASWFSAASMLKTLTLPFTEVDGGDLSTVLKATSSSLPCLCHLILVWNPRRWYDLTKKRIGGAFVDRLIGWMDSRETAGMRVAKISLTKPLASASMKKLWLAGKDHSVEIVVNPDAGALWDESRYTL